MSVSRAIELFDAGAQSLGLLGGPPNLDEAAKLFEAAASADSQMCDAFLGQADVLRRRGEPIPADLTLQMYSVRHRLGEQQARLGFQPGALTTRVFVRHTRTRCSTPAMGRRRSSS